MFSFWIDFSICAFMWSEGRMNLMVSIEFIRRFEDDFVSGCGYLEVVYKGKK